MEIVLRIPANSIPYRKQFHSAKQHTSESMMDFYNRLKELAELCNYGCYIEVLVLEQFVIGLDDTILKSLCATQDYFSLTNIVDICRSEFSKELFDFKSELAMSELCVYNNYHDDTDNNYVERDVVYVQPEDLTVETQSHKSVPDKRILFECYLCHLVLRTVGHLIYHFVRHHTTGMTSNCKLCGKFVTNSTRNMVTHLNKHFNTKSYRCTKCDFMSAAAITLKRHFREHNGLNVQIFNCSKCDKRFITKRNLIDHIKTHDSPTISISQKLDQILKKRKSMKAKATTQLNCKICFQSYENQKTYDDHMKLHSESQWLCHLCGKKLKNERNLKYHYRSHEGVKPFKCEQCDKAFGIIEKLKLHSKIHSNVKPFCCKLCNKSYIQKGHLIRHIKTHAVKEKAFKCDQCPRQFIDQVKFEMHLRIHAGHKPYDCFYCNKSFKVSWHRTDHERIHTGEKPYKCTFTSCDKRFGHRSCLSGHLKRHARSKATPTKKVERKKREIFCQHS